MLTSDLSQGGRASCFWWTMNWIRVAVAIADDPDVHFLAGELEVRLAEAVGLIVSTLVKFPEHAPDGNLSQIPDSLIERWAGWEGEKGRYATELRARFLDGAGVWASWEKHNGAAMRDALAARERARKWRLAKLENEASTAYATGNGSPNGSLLRTNERTNQTTGGRGRQNGDQPAPYKPDPFCKECGGGMGKLKESDRKQVIIHREDCANA